MRRVAVDMFDLMSIAVPGIAAVGAVGAVAGAASGLWWPVGVGLVLVALVAVAVWVPRRRQQAAVAVDGVRLVAANLWYQNPRMSAGVRSVLEVEPDVVVVSELSAEAHAVFAGHFVHHEVLRLGGATGHGVYSRFPLERLPDLPVLGQVLWVRVLAPTPFHLCAAHLLRPTVVAPMTAGSAPLAVCREHVGRVAEVLGSVPDAVVAGDLNLSDRQPGYRVLVRGRLDAMRTVRARDTFVGQGVHAYWRLFAMRIDHVVVPADWAVSEARVVRIAGSDHRAVCATIAPRGRGVRHH